MPIKNNNNQVMNLKIKKFISITKKSSYLTNKQIYTHLLIISFKIRKNAQFNVSVSYSNDSYKLKGFSKQYSC